MILYLTQVDGRGRNRAIKWNSHPPACEWMAVGEDKVGGALSLGDG